MESGFGDYLVIVALGIKSDGTKKVLDIREGSIENSEVCKSLISSLTLAAYAEFDYKAAKVRLDEVAKRIEYRYPSAAESIREGPEETLTLYSLGIPGLLRISLSSTDPIESALSTARKTTGRVKHWQSGIQVLRWLSCGFMGAEKKFRKINGYKLIPVLINALQGKRVLLLQ